MDIERHTIPRSSLQDFADKYRLALVLRERPKEVTKHGVPKYYVKFPTLELKDRGLLLSTFGDGDTEDLAIEDYIKQISGKPAVLGAMTGSRQDIQIPMLFLEAETQQAEDLHQELIESLKGLYKLVEGTTGEIYETMNPYARPQMRRAGKALNKALGLKSGAIGYDQTLFEGKD